MYYVMCRYAGMTMKDLVHPFNVRDLNINDIIVKTNVMCYMFISE